MSGAASPDPAAYLEGCCPDCGTLLESGPEVGRLLAAWSGLTGWGGWPFTLCRGCGCFWLLHRAGLVLPDCFGPGAYYTSLRDRGLVRRQGHDGVLLRSVVIGMDGWGQRPWDGRAPCRLHELPA